MIDRCGSCDLSCRFVGASGPEPCEVVFIGEKPGYEEDRRMMPFVGDTGRELDRTYLPLAGLSRADVYVTNAVKCRLGGNNNKPSDEQIRECAAYHLPLELDRTKPTVIVLMGATACSLVPEIELEKEHGIPRQGTLFNWSGWVLPMYHPAAGLHDTSMMIPLLDDFERMGRWFRGSWQPVTSDLPTHYDVIESLDQLYRALEGSVYSYLPVDTENDGSRPFSLQFSPRPGEGYLISASRRDLLRGFAVCWYDFDGLLLHNAPHDLDVMEAMGIESRRYRDTMQEAYHLGHLPQALKSLAYRLLGSRMRSWEDVVMPYSRQRMIAWLMEQWDDAAEHRERVEVQLKTKVKVVFKPSQRERDLKRILKHSHKPGYDLWEKTAEIELTGGPIASIAHVPLAEAIEYACKDADVTGQIGTRLEQERARLMATEWQVDQEDWDADFRLERV